MMGISRRPGSPPRTPCRPAARRAAAGRGPRRRLAWHGQGGARRSRGLGRSLAQALVLPRRIGLLLGNPFHQPGSDDVEVVGGHRDRSVTRLASKCAWRSAVIRSSSAAVTTLPTETSSVRRLAAELSSTLRVRVARSPPRTWPTSPARQAGPPRRPGSTRPNLPNACPGRPLGRVLGCISGCSCRKRFATASGTGAGGSPPRVPPCRAPRQPPHKPGQADTAHLLHTAVG
jgi:hypothetical protein